MRIAVVRGTVVSTQKISSMTGVKLVVVQWVDESGEPLPGYDVAADTVGSGVGEWVLISQGSAARQEEGYHQRPLDALVVGIIDTVTVERGFKYSKRDSDRLR
ncbi:MAG: EutN/CcmL family microcompartment protein [Cyanobacteria bacterium P01_H01_bin.15]